MTGRDDRLARGARCDASEWGLALGCGSADDTVVCPLCEDAVTALRHRWLQNVLVVAPHAAINHSETGRRVA